MPFRRLFDRGAKREEPAAAEPEEQETEETEEIEPEAAEDEEYADVQGSPEDAPEIDWRARALHIVPGGASTGSKRPLAMHGVEDADAPTHFIGSAGCRVFGTDGREYIDCTMALGAVALGYAEPEVNAAVARAVNDGTVSGLSSYREVELAERLCDIVPCAETALFLKTGAEAVAAAVRIARTYTGRDAVIGSGYFGWLDWCSDAAGVPAGTRADFRNVPFDDVAALEQAATELGGRLAAIVLEPVVERMPSPQWIARARQLCDAVGAVLIFDEIKTGFRLHPGGYQEQSEVKPDLATFSKAIANGFPLAAVVGQKALMESARRTWISSTLAGETVGLAAASAVLDWHARVEVCESLAEIGREMRERVATAVEASGVSGVEVAGIDQMWLMRWDDPARHTRFQELAARHGVLFKRGAYNFASLAHDDDTLGTIEAAASAALVELRDEERGAR